MIATTDPKHIDLQLLKQTVPVLDLARERGLDPRRHGNGTWKVNCPFHEDGQASLVITPSKNLWHCFGCDKGGSNIDFVAELDRVSVRDAILALAEKAALHPGLEGRRDNGRLAVAEPAAATTEDRPPITPARQKLLNKAAEFYHKTFIQDPDGRAYLRERGLTDAALYESFKLGYANGTIFDAIPAEAESPGPDGVGSDMLDDLKAIGIINQRGHEHFRDCVVFPVLDRHGNVTEIYGRKIHVPSAAKGKAKKANGKKGRAPVRHLYLPGPHRGVWNHYALRMPTTTAGDGDRAHGRASYRTVLLTESILDAAAIWQAGWRHVIPCYGAQGFTTEHVELIRDSQVERLILVMDGDDSGRQAVEKVKRKLDGIEVDIRVAKLPEGDDPAEYLHTHSVEEFGELLAAACDNEAVADNAQLAESNVTPTENGFRLVVESRTYDVLNAEGKPGRIRATIKAVTKDRLRFHIDTVDLYLARSRKAFAADTARLYGIEADTITLDLNRIIQASETHLQKDASGPDEAPAIITDPKTEKEARAFGRRPDLLDLVHRDVEKLGYIGERCNVLATYLTMTSRKMPQPLAMMILSGSGAGKSALQDTVLSLCPDEDLVKVTSLTERALFYKDEFSLKHKVLALEEVAGAEDASYAIRSLISSGILIIESTIKDALSGRMTTMQNKVYGPTAVLQTTTNPNVDPETLSRFLLGTIDESREQTRRILDAQRKARTVEGLRAKLLCDAIREKHHAFQRMLRPLDVRNPFGELLTYTDDRLLMRRDNPKYLALIEAVAFLYQQQKPVKRLTAAGKTVEYIEVSLRDIALANELSAEILGKSLDELSGPSRRLLQLIEQATIEWAKAQGIEPCQVEFTRRQIREYTRWSDYQIKTHIRQLEELEYLIPCTGRPGQRFTYRLAWHGEGQDGKPFFLGLKPVDELRREAEILGIVQNPSSPEGYDVTNQEGENRNQEA